MIPFVSDPDFDLYVGDVREVLAELPDASVNCCVTSPPYWNLRDYGTGEWTGGDPTCDHFRPTTTMNVGFNERWGQGAGERKQEHKSDGQYAGSCPKCGATRVDQQIGLEQTPDAYVAALVGVFREVRRVLADDGTLWLNLGDSYFGTGRGPSDLADDRGFHTKVTRDGFPLKGVYTHEVLKSKDLVGIPWRVAFALQADGWFLRSDIIWAKPNPMPESVTDRPTKSHEYVFLLSKSPRYYFDQEAVREKRSATSHGGNSEAARVASGGGNAHREAAWHDGTSRSLGPSAGDSGRNIRSVWEIATQPYAEAHFATFPEELPRRCIAAGCPEWVCATCGKARERLVETNNPSKADADPENTLGWANTHSKTSNAQSSKSLHRQPGGVYSTAVTIGWSDCGHDDYRPGVVLDPFMGSGTTALVARKLGRRAVGVELNPEYAALCAKRLQQQSLFA